MAKVYEFLANGFEEIEGLAPVDILRRGGVDIKTVSITGSEFVETSHGITVKADLKFEDVKDFSDADMLLLPGGLPGSTNLNEHEGAALSGTDVPEKMLVSLRERFPRAQFVLTLGDAGAYFAGHDETFFCPACDAVPVDTTGAGDTFTGYLVAAITSGKTPREAMGIASRAAAISITRRGASSSIPAMEEVQKAMR